MPAGILKRRDLFDVGDDSVQNGGEVDALSPDAIMCLRAKKAWLMLFESS